MGAQHSKQPYYPRWGFQEAFGLSPHCSAAAAPQSSESGSSNDVSEVRAYVDVVVSVSPPTQVKTDIERII